VLPLVYFTSFTVFALSAEAQNRSSASLTCISARDPLDPFDRVLVLVFRIPSPRSCPQAGWREVILKVCQRLVTLALHLAWHGRAGTALSVAMRIHICTILVPDYPPVSHAAVLPYLWREPTVLKHGYVLFASTITVTMAKCTSFTLSYWPCSICTFLLSPWNLCADILYALQCFHLEFKTRFFYTPDRCSVVTFTEIKTRRYPLPLRYFWIVSRSLIGSPSPELGRGQTMFYLSLIGVQFNEPVGIGL